MNLSLFRSVHAVVAALVVAGFGFWLYQGGFEIGRKPGSDLSYLLWSGWVAVAFYAILFLYAVRKYVHKTGISPEFNRKIPIEQFEKAQLKLGEVRARIVSGELATKGRILGEAKRVLRDEKVTKILRVSVRRRRSGGPRFELIVGWKEPLVRIAKWMHAHIFYGLAAAVLVWWHGGGNFSTPMGLLLNGLSYLVIGTGIIGIVIWAFGPAWMTRKERDLSLEKAFVLRDHFPRKIEAAESALLAKSEEEGALSSAALVERLRRVKGTERGFPFRVQTLIDDLENEYPREFQEYRNDVRDVLALKGQCHNVEKAWRGLSRARFVLNAWRVVHIPLSIFLLVAVVVHVLSVWWY